MSSPASRYRSRARHRIDDDLIELLEGELSKLRDKAKANPQWSVDVALPGRYVEALIDVPLRTINAWRREAVKTRAADEFKCFAELYEKFVSLFASRYEKNIAAIANDPANRNSLAASIKLLERTGDEHWSPTSLVEVDEGVGGIPADLADYLEDDEVDALLVREAAKQREQQQDEALLDKLRARKAQRRISGDD
jgi:hypothetical protein